MTRRRKSPERILGCDGMISLSFIGPNLELDPQGCDSEVSQMGWLTIEVYFNNSRGQESKIKKSIIGETPSLPTPVSASVFTWPSSLLTSVSFPLIKTQIFGYRPHPASRVISL